MRSIRATIIGFATLISIGSVHAADVEYLGRDGASHAVVMRDGAGRTHHVAKGESYGGLGELREADEEEAVFEHVLGDDERESLEAQGWLAPDVRRIRIPRTPDGGFPSLAGLSPHL